MKHDHIIKEADRLARWIACRDPFVRNFAAKNCGKTAQRNAIDPFAFLKPRRPFSRGSLLAKQLKIKVRFKEMGEMKGLYTIIKQTRFICINENLNRHESEVACAHEIGHDRFHKDLARIDAQALTGYEMRNKPELEANIFAAEFLIADDAVLKALEWCDDSFSALAGEMGVLPDLLALKLEIMRHNKGHSDLRAPYYPRPNFFR